YPWPDRRPAWRCGWDKAWHRKHQVTARTEFYGSICLVDLDARVAVLRIEFYFHVYRPTLFENPSDGGYDTFHRLGFRILWCVGKPGSLGQPEAAADSNGRSGQGAHRNTACQTVFHAALRVSQSANPAGFAFGSHPNGMRARRQTAAGERLDRYRQCSLWRTVRLRWFCRGADQPGWLRDRPPGSGWSRCG